MIPYTFGLSKNVYNRDIVKLSTGLYIAIFHISIEYFRPAPGNLSFYADNNGDLLAFEIKHCTDAVEEITEALKWYATFINNPGMEIQLNDPRRLVN